MVSANYIFSLLVLAPLLVQAQPTKTSSAPLAKRSPHYCFPSGHWGYIRDVLSSCSQATVDLSNQLVGRNYAAQRTYGPFSTGSGRRAVVSVKVANDFGRTYETVHGSDINFACNEIVQRCAGDNRDTRGGWSIQGPFKITVDVNACGC
ncbi:hypothetical protein RMATCC62417_01074 [Rhizopus microsporus]|nr:hypothetical protein RMATCC62417_01074 [Rhizopus microsporus]CEJ04591.1 hypothetical protein RMCBS344292_18546 [Rhizopus microsporus]